MILSYGTFALLELTLFVLLHLTYKKYAETLEEQLQERKEKIGSAWVYVVIALLALLAGAPFLFLKVVETYQLLVIAVVEVINIVVAVKYFLAAYLLVTIEEAYNGDGFAKTYFHIVRVEKKRKKIKIEIVDAKGNTLTLEY